MKYKALVSFAGKISMGKGEVREIVDRELANYLLQPHYIEPVEVEEVTEPVEVEETAEEVEEVTEPVVEKKSNKKSK